jgi:opacity protein-like surface antigen
MLCQNLLVMLEKLMIKLILGLPLLLITFNTFAGDWKENWVYVHAGKLEHKYSHNVYGVEASYQLDNNIYLSGMYDISKETQGGFDNNALNTYSAALTAGYLFNLTQDTKLQVGYMHQRVDIKNVEMGGIRSGVYENNIVRGNGLRLRLVQHISENISGDVEFLKVWYDTSLANNNLRAGLNYELVGNWYGRADYQATYREDYHSYGWSAGLGYRF